ncbi:Maf-like protein [Rhizobium pusense]|jgi:septum formation protein|uniref:dTTP/UTP pyrophosphatase n=3 Tax=Hyphomicrobiales TaxID=356 RepID=A0A1L9CX66_9HYPH|nr:MULTISPECIES: Maf-like protein [Rhizobium/Agrobacterium group]AMD60804.1 septum formation inhibitor Maf [Agrobacterium tumefaciens]ANV24451.1 septum formation protein Maf [Rhizobium sp. S41]AUC08893.1 septum formation protein Maf [Rhizobium sp. Y9]EKJ96892.1 Maf-like protein [Bradyrhizobium lupini HPC(L)]KGE81447.1 septum formation inhibitor Maf [Rhizobium sp. H41]KIV62309.1 Septum formation protein Maf [Rhizobium sp. UR51a]MBB2904069.1 septum formation protein [Rhizobium sp. RAS22]MBM73
MTNSKQKLVLASGSPRRLELLHQIGIEPARLMPMDIDETPVKLEHPRTLCRRLSLQKAEAAQAALKNEQAWKDAYVLGSDTVVAVGRRIVGKAEYTEEASAALHLLSGRSHWVYTGICLVTPGGKIRQKVAETKVRFKRLSTREIDAYIASGQWRGKAGAYGIQGIAGAFVQKLTGSYTNVVGLPLYETMSLLAGEGFEVTSGWLEG